MSNVDETTDISDILEKAQKAARANVQLAEMGWPGGYEEEDWARVEVGIAAGILGTLETLKELGIIAEE